MFNFSNNSKMKVNRPPKPSPTRRRDEVFAANDVRFLEQF